jgi:hypothetical protein
MFKTNIGANSKELKTASRLAIRKNPTRTSLPCTKRPRTSRNKCSKQIRTNLKRVEDCFKTCYQRMPDQDFIALCKESKICAIQVDCTDNKRNELLYTKLVTKGWYISAQLSEQLDKLLAWEIRFYRESQHRVATPDPIRIINGTKCPKTHQKWH